MSATRSDNLLSLHNVDKEYHFRPVLHRISVGVERGRAYWLQAPNGSGKTTLLKVMAGLVKPTRGGVHWCGRPITRRDRAHFGVVLQAPWVYGDLTGMENLMLYAGLHGMSLSKRRETAREWLRKVELLHVADRRVREYSKGMMQRLSLARAMLHQPQILLLDEPFEGLDTGGIQLMAQLLDGARATGTSLVMTGHGATQTAFVDVRWTLRNGQLLELVA